MTFRMLQRMLRTAVWTGLVVSASAQTENNELGLLIGAEVIPGTSISGTPSIPLRYGRSETFQLNYARRLRQYDKAALWLEFPALAGPSHSIQQSDPSLPTSLATFYVTPSFRVALPPGSRFTPWLSFGGGYSLFETSAKLANGTSNLFQLTSVAALQFGGGIDVKTPVRVLFPVALRVEVRDFYTLSGPALRSATAGPAQHNVAVSGGLILRF